MGLLKLFNLTFQGITNYAKLIREMTKVLRPGGMLHLQEWDFFVSATPNAFRECAEVISQIAAGSEKTRLSDDARPFARWCSKFRDGLQARKASIDAGTTLEAMIRSENAFGEVHQKDIWMPVGPPLTKGASTNAVWQNLTKSASIDQPQSTHMNLVGEFMRENVKVGLAFPHQFPGLITNTTQAFIKGARAVTLQSGVTLEECIQLELDATRDIQFSTTPLFLRLNCVWAQKLMQRP